MQNNYQDSTRGLVWSGCHFIPCGTCLALICVNRHLVYLGNVRAVGNEGILPAVLAVVEERLLLFELG